MIAFSESNLDKKTVIQITEMARKKRVPNTLLWTGIDGGSALIAALSLAKYMVCDSPSILDSCNQCPSCLQFNHFNYPDLHLSFPFFKTTSSSKETNCADFRALFTSVYANNNFLTTSSWLIALEAENKQVSITVAEAKAISHTLSLKGSSKKPRFVVFWQPERMNINACNKLLKLIEEPNENTYIFFVSHQPKLILKTILSRCVIYKIPTQREEEIEKFLVKNGADQTQIPYVLTTAEGSVGRALDTLKNIEVANLTADMLVSWLRLLYTKDIGNILNWSEALSLRNREEIKHFLSYTIQVIRQAYLTNQHSLASKSFEHNSFNLSKFAPFISAANTFHVLSLLENCKADISRNSHQKSTILDTSLQLSKYIG